jgi:hypothetical protein
MLTPARVHAVQTDIQDLILKLHFAAGELDGRYQVVFTNVDCAVARRLRTAF